MHDVSYGLTDKNFLALQLTLTYEDGSATSWFLAKSKDIKQLFVQTNTAEVSQLEHVVVEAYVDGPMLKGISVNPHLAASDDSD